MIYKEEGGITSIIQEQKIQAFSGKKSNFVARNLLRINFKVQKGKFLMI